ncbi:MAG: arylsulfatase [Bryobacterales bacterium]|nr:arylsulfatase [Bryobacterales bacterium]
MNPITRRELLAGAAASVLPLRGAAKKPNVIWMMADDMGYGDLGCYGQKSIKTPNIDKLATQGTRFTDAYAGCTVCAPSRSCLMTGLHTGHTPIRCNVGGAPLLPEERTVANVMKDAGYNTGLFGKWGLGDINTTGVPWKHGFDEFVGFLHQAHAHFQYPRFLYDNDKELHLKGNDTPGRQTFANDVMNQRALDFVRRNKSNPFYLYLSWTVPHFEPHVPEDSLSAYRGRVPNGEPFVNKQGRLKNQSELGPAYAGMVSRIDNYTGALLSLLRELKLEEDTLIFFTSDNGGIMGNFHNDYFNNTSGLRGQKTTMYEGGLRVPMITRWPGKIAAGKTNNYVWHFADFLPTAAEAAGAKAPSGLDGVSVLPTLLGKQQKPHESLYWELPRYDAATKSFRKEKPMAAMRRGTMKILRPKPDAAVELYDLAADRTEKNDLAAKMPDVTQRMEQQLAASRTEPRHQDEPLHPWWDARS